MKGFAWQISVETENEEYTFRVRHSVDKISDAEIRAFLAIVCKNYDIDIPANFIYNLTFIAVDDNGHRYAESLSPL